MRICAAIPTRDEAGGITSVLSQVRPFVDEILVIDGGSWDETVELARETSGVRVIEVPHGKGIAIRTALYETDCDIVVYFDGDGSHEPRDIPHVVSPIIDGCADIVVASRITGGSDEFEAGGAHRIRQLGLRGMTYLVNATFGSKLTDVLNGFRALHRERAGSLPLSAEGFDIELELIIRALARGFRVREVSSHEYSRRWGRSKLPTSAGIPMTFHLFNYLSQNASRGARHTDSWNLKQATAASHNWGWSGENSPLSASGGDQLGSRPTRYA